MCAAQNNDSVADPPSSDRPGWLFRQGRLEEAIDAASAAVRLAPRSAPARMLLAEMLLFSGAFERADTILAAAEAIDVSMGLVVAEFRQLLRAEQARQQVWREGRLPEFLNEPTLSLNHSLKALTLLRAGDTDAAAVAAEAAEAARARVAGSHDGTPFDDFRDVDDLCGGFIEVLTTTGRYFWVPVEQIDTATFHPRQRLRDLFWRRCSMTLREGPDGDVYVPALYVNFPMSVPGPFPAVSGLHDASEPGDIGMQARLRIGQATEWSRTAPVRGHGQRLFLAGEEALAMQDLAELVVGPASVT